MGLLTLAFAGASCIKDDLGLPAAVKEGVPITLKVTLSTAPTSDITITRADHSYSDLETLTLFVYNADGTNCEQVLTLESGQMTILGDQVGPKGERLYQITFETTSGEKRLIGVANYTTDQSGFWSGFTSLKNNAEAKSLTFDGLLRGLLSLRSGLLNADGDLNLPTLASSSQMLISGWNTGAVFDSDGTVTDFGTRGGDGILLKMDRAMARITFKIPAASPPNAGRTVTFTPSTFRVYNVPKQTPLVTLAPDVSGASLHTPDFLADENFLRSALTNVESVSGGSYSFTFYMPENVQAEVESLQGTSEALYPQRDMWNGDETPGATPENKKWTYAPQNSTFVVISGTYTETDGNNPYYTGNVNYTVHLGDFSDEGSMGNFSVERNYSYTYNMSVLGVDNIVVEAKKESGEYQQGAEGEIYDANNCVYNYQLDAHYEQVYLQYNLSNIAKSLESGLTEEALDDAISSKLILVIQSEAMDHNSNGVVNKRGSLQPYKTYADAVRNAADPDQAAADAKSDILDDDPANTNPATPVKGFDYKWIEFWPQTETTLVSYPGTPTWSQAYLEAYAPTETQATQAQYLMDVYDVIVAMGKVVKKIYLNNQNTISTADRAEDGITVTQDGNNNYVARFTAFVNEYYYYAHPLTEASLTTWSVLTNKIPREMVIAMSTNVSTDGNSSFSQIHSYISQVSMQTFYNSRTEQINAFGIETYNETPLTFSYGNPSTYGTLSDANGRENQIRLLGSAPGAATSSYGNWSTYVTASNNGWTSTVTTDHSTHKLQDAAYPYNYRYAYSACMSRNRDLNGNGTIDDNEVRWYLASLNEYIRMGIGAGAISNAAQLYIGDKTTMVKSSYPYSYIGSGSLFYTSSASDKRIYWAVEKGSYGGVETYTGTQPPIRCVRVLPAIGNGQTASTVNGVVAASTVEKLTDNGTGLTVLKFKGRLVDDLYRQRVDGSLDPHNEDDPANSFYDGIFVADSYLSGTYQIGNIIGYYGTMSNPCPSGWRVPNLVELSAMNAVGGILGGSNDTICCTQFSNQNIRYGFAYSSLVYCPGGGENDSLTSTYSVRCVKDVPADYDFETQSSPVN